jgi:hypothetical protein
MRILVTLAVAACLSGCDLYNAVVTPAPDKVNAAFPLADELQLARNRLFASLEGDPAGLAQVKQQFQQLMVARALTCSASHPVGRFDTPAAIKARLTDTQCFATQDAQLEEWVGVRRVGLVFRAPPLVPPAALPPRTLLPSTAEPFATAMLAAEANVLVLRGYQQRFTALQVPAGKEISSFSVAESQGRNPSLSPNGRLLAVPAGKGLRFHEVESGKLLWSTEKLQDVVGWAPKLGLIVLSQAGTGAPQMLDAVSGRIEAYPATEKRLTWSLPLADGRLLVGSQGTASLMEQSRDGSGALAVRAVRQWPLAGGMAYQTAPMLMHQGNRVVYASGNRDLAWIDLATGAQGNWQLSAVNANGFAKLGEHLVAFDSSVAGTTTLPTRVLDTDKQLVLAARDMGARDGQMVGFAPRAGFLKRGPNAMTLVGSLETEEPQEVERYLSEALLARQLAKLAQQEQEAKLLGAPLLQGLPANARVSIVGVYEAETGSHGHGKPRTPGPITVTVASGSTPVVLVLASYEPVNWVIQGSRKPVAVLVSGYHPSTVSGQGAAQVVRIGSSYAYKVDSGELRELQRTVARYVGPLPQQFQGGYKGSQFQVQ